jgi:UbiD family decarboxylase
MPYGDMRDWIAKLEEEGELKRIRAEVDWNEEIGGITQRVLDMKDRGPALLFENIKDYKATPCRKLFTSSLATYGRIALMLGLPKNTPVKEIIRTVREGVKTAVKPVIVRQGSCKENIMKGDKVNILDFPVPKWHAQDGGRYINTFGAVITKHPREGWTNVGLYRGMVVDERTIAWGLQAGKHWGQHYHEYRSMGKPMPVAVVYGWDPIMTFGACAPHPAGVSEYEIMGALRHAPVELIRCETVDLEVPASAEIVLEGFMPIEPESFEMEGPMGEYTGYYGGAQTRRPVMKVTCVTHRNDPIFQGTLEGHPPTEDSRCSSVSLSVAGWQALQRLGVPGIVDVFCPSTAPIPDVRVQINKRYHGHAKQVASCLWAASVESYKNVVVVDEDIDIYDPDDLEWAIAYRVDPKEDIVILPGSPGSPLDPSVDPRGRDGGGKWNRLLIDATKTWRYGPREEWGGERFPPRADVTAETKQKVDRRWKEYGF